MMRDVRCTVLLVGLLALASVSAHGEDSPLSRATLRGLPGVQVIVEDIAPEAERNGLLRNQLQTVVEHRLQQAGMRVLPEGERLATPGAPYLYIHVATSKRTDMPPVRLVRRGIGTTARGAGARAHCRGVWTDMERGQD